MTDSGEEGATARRLTRCAEELLGADRAAELAPRIAVLAGQLALVCAADSEPLPRWARDVAGGAGG